jgi:hypothetical protein
MMRIIYSHERIEPPEYEDKLTLEEEADRRSLHDEFEYEKWREDNL